MAIPQIPAYDIPSAGSWPACRARWTLQPARVALLIHDMQSYFLEPYDTAASPLGPLLRNVVRLRAACLRSNIPVFFSAQPGEQSQAERGLLWDLWGPGIIERPGAERLAAALTPGPTDVLVPKRRYSAFYETQLGEHLSQQGRDQLLICGVYAHIGCLATALDGFMRGIQPFVVSDATADFSREDHEVALRQVARTCGMVNTTHEAVLEIDGRYLRSALADLVASPVDTIALDDDLADHGLDSVRAIQLFERVLPVNHGRDFSELVEARSLRDLSALLSPSMANLA